MQVGWRRADKLMKKLQDIPSHVLQDVNAYYGQTWGPMWKHVIEMMVSIFNTHSDSPGKNESSTLLVIDSQGLQSPYQQGMQTFEGDVVSSKFTSFLAYAWGPLISDKILENPSCICRRSTNSN